jgi:EpsI family protein
MRRTAWLLPAALLVQAGFVRWTAASERPPAIPDLSRLEKHLGAWQLLREDPIATEVQAQLGADQLVSRTYAARPGGTAASLLVAWFQSQSHGTRQPHSPQVCLPGGGWMPLVTDRVRIQAGGESFSANRYVVRSHGQTAVVLYWYQTSRRAVASEWASKFWTVWDALSQRRTDIALIRVVTWAAGTDYRAATANGTAFVKELYPALRAALPR